MTSVLDSPVSTPAAAAGSPRPTLDVLPGCPSWCTEDHAVQFGPDARPARWGAEHGVRVWDLDHRCTIGHGDTSVRMGQWTAIRADGRIAQSEPAEVWWSWDRLGESVTPATAAELAANLLRATELLAKDGAPAT